MNNIEKILEMLKEGDETLSGSCWEELNYSYLDTPKDIINDVIETYISNEIYSLENVTEEEKRLALAEYFEYLAKELRENYG